MGTSVAMRTFILCRKIAKISIFPQNWRLKVHDLHFKWLWSTLLVYSISLVAFLLISVLLRTSLDMGTFMIGQKIAKIGRFGQNRRLKVHNMQFEWFWSTSVIDCISLVALITNSSLSRYLTRSLGLHFMLKMAEPAYLVEINGSRSYSSFKEYRSTLSVGFTSLAAFLSMSVHLDS